MRESSATSPASGYRAGVPGRAVQDALFYRLRRDIRLALSDASESPAIIIDTNRQGGPTLR